MIGVPGEEDALEAVLGLGDLAGLTINNEADALSYDVSLIKKESPCFEKLSAFGYLTLDAASSYLCCKVQLLRDVQICSEVEGCSNMFRVTVYLKRVERFDHEL